MAAENLIAGAMAGINPLGAALSIAPTVFGLFTSNAQRRRAAAIRPQDPGFATNTGVLDNKRLVTEMYNNFTLPGMQQAKSDLAGNMASGFASAVQGASSSGDVIDIATKLAYQNNEATNNLNVQQATAKQDLFPMVLGANEAAGNELVRRNQYDEQRYQEQLREKAALTQAAAVNGFNAADNLATLGGSIFNYNLRPEYSGVRKRS